MKNQWFSRLDTLLHKLVNYADEMSFVIRDNDDGYTELTDSLQSYLIRIDVVSEWPGTALLTGTAHLYSYYLNADTAFILTQYQNNLFRWLAPSLPEDITVYKNGRPIFVSITHELDCYFDLNEEDKKVLGNLNTN